MVAAPTRTRNRTPRDAGALTTGHHVSTPAFRNLALGNAFPRARGPGRVSRPEALTNARAEDSGDSMRKREGALANERKGGRTYAHTGGSRAASSQSTSTSMRQRPPAVQRKPRLCLPLGFPRREFASHANSPSEPRESRLDVFFFWQKHAKRLLLTGCLAFLAQILISKYLKLLSHADEIIDY